MIRLKVQPELGRRPQSSREQRDGGVFLKVDADQARKLLRD
ncbi:MAG: hypothetical protein ABR548_05565 [Actinomycetota bacterium]